MMVGQPWLGMCWAATTGWCVVHRVQTAVLCSTSHQRVYKKWLLEFMKQSRLCRLLPDSFEFHCISKQVELHHLQHL